MRLKHGTLRQGGIFMNQERPDIPIDEYPVLMPLSREMHVDLVIGRNGKVSLVHNRPLTYVLKWIEFDPDLRALTLISDKGKLQGAGLKIPKEFIPQLLKTRDMAVMRAVGDQVEDMYIVPVIKPLVTLH